MITASKSHTRRIERPLKAPLNSFEDLMCFKNNVFGGIEGLDVKDTRDMHNNLWLMRFSFFNTDCSMIRDVTCILLIQVSYPV